MQGYNRCGARRVELLNIFLMASVAAKIDALIAYIDSCDSKIEDDTQQIPQGCYRIVTNENDKGGPEKMQIETFNLNDKEFILSNNEILIQVKAIGINFIDTYHRSGLYPNPSNRLGKEGSGIVIKIGKNVTKFKPNDYICWFGVQGSYATHIKLNENNSSLIKIPKFMIDNYPSYVFFVVFLLLLLFIVCKCLFS